MAEEHTRLACVSCQKDLSFLDVYDSSTWWPCALHIIEIHGKNGEKKVQLATIQHARYRAEEMLWADRGYMYNNT